MRFDPQIEVNCDECCEVRFWEPEFVYHDWSGENGYYDTSDEAFKKWKISEGWSADDDKCDGCMAVEDEG